MNTLHTADSSRENSASGTRMVTGLFKDRESAERAYTTVSSRGYGNHDINVVMSDDTRQKHFADRSGIQTELGNKAAEGAGIGGAVGGTLGVIAAAVAAIGTSVVIPGLGFVIAGPLAAALLGAGAGGLTGGLVGALVGWSMPEERVKHYETAIQDGGILIGVKPRSEADAQHFEKEWQGNAGQYVFR